MDLPLHTLYSAVEFQDSIAVLAAALGCGLLIGLERERHQFQEKKEDFAGLRSFCLSALLGVLCFAFGIEIGAIGAILVGGFAWHSVWTQKDDQGVTTELAFCMSYFIGALCWWNIAIAAGVSVAVTIILWAKEDLHGIASHWITETELRDGLLLLALALIALPLMPNQPLWGPVLNPYLIVKLLVLILSVQALAHLAQRLFSNQQALIFSALASGFVSSTATIATLGVKVRAGQGHPVRYAAAALMSCVSTLIELLLIIANSSWVWFKLILLPCLIAGTVLVFAALWLLRIGGHQVQENMESQSIDSRMFSLKQAVLIALILTLIQVVVYGLGVLLGHAGLIAGTVLASFFEIHAAMAAVVLQGDPRSAQGNILLFAVMLGLLMHAFAKSINASLSGGWKYGLAFAPVQIFHMLLLVMLLWGSIHWFA
ncbi:MgtC/SapB family protein [Acinetobacter sp. MB5]|uniref:MgtC/SapB family protein n=1 Tax=Acinetobacter sp. MB5 TaxID=2069438 RepID=UPI000DCF7BCD|nr:MgtC/SapB family protein [Acinetobacter sp. MB5]